MSIILFAMLGAMVHVGPWYWICFGIFCMFKFLKVVLMLFGEDEK